MKIKMILPALTEAKSPFFRPIKYSLFPPLGLASLAAFFPSDWEVEIVDEHVEILDHHQVRHIVPIQDFYDTRHAVFRPARMHAETLESGYWQAYQDFYKWGSIFSRGRCPG